MVEYFFASDSMQGDIIPLTGDGGIMAKEQNFDIFGIKDYFKVLVLREIISTKSEKNGIIYYDT